MGSRNGWLGLAVDDWPIGVEDIGARAADRKLLLRWPFGPTTRPSVQGRPGRKPKPVANPDDHRRFGQDLRLVGNAIDQSPALTPVGVDSADQSQKLVDAGSHATAKAANEVGRRGGIASPALAVAAWAGLHGRWWNGSSSHHACGTEAALRSGPIYRQAIVSLQRFVRRLAKGMPEQCPGVDR